VAALSPFVYKPQKGIIWCQPLAPTYLPTYLPRIVPNGPNLALSGSGGRSGPSVSQGLPTKISGGQLIALHTVYIFGPGSPPVKKAWKKILNIFPAPTNQPGPLTFLTLTSLFWFLFLGARVLSMVARVAPFRVLWSRRDVKSMFRRITRLSFDFCPIDVGCELDSLCVVINVQDRSPHMSFILKGSHI
jgi:hypothetical protein